VAAAIQKLFPPAPLEVLGLVLPPALEASEEALAVVSAAVEAEDFAVGSVTVAGSVTEAVLVTVVALVTEAALATEVASEAVSEVVPEVVLDFSLTATDPELQMELHPDLGDHGGKALVEVEAGMKIGTGVAHSMIGPAAAAATVNLSALVEPVGTETATVMELEKVGTGEMNLENDHAKAISTMTQEVSGGIDLQHLLATVTHIPHFSPFELPVSG